VVGLNLACGASGFEWPGPANLTGRDAPAKPDFAGTVAPSNRKTVIDDLRAGMNYPPST
jgi:hypothetical protein